MDDIKDKILQIKIKFFINFGNNLKKLFFPAVLIIQIFFLFIISIYSIGYSPKAYSPIRPTINIENIKTFNSRFEKFIKTNDDYCYVIWILFY